MNIQKKAPILIGTVLFLIFLIGSATYAYFASESQISDNLNISTDFASNSPSFTAYVEKDLNLQINPNDMLQNSSTSVKSADSIIKVDLLSSQDDIGVVCTYDIDLVWRSGEYTPSTTLPTEDAEHRTYPYELSLKATRQVTDDDGYSYVDKNLSEINLDKISFTTDEGEKRATIISGAEIHNQSATTKTLTTWTFTLNFYSLPVSQDALLGKSLSGHLAVTNVVC